MSFIYRIQPGIYDYPWSNIDGLLSKINRGTEIVQGDGFCFLSSIIKCLEVDHEIKLNIQEVKDLVVEQALEFHDKCVEFHTSTLNIIPHYMLASDNFVSEILDFFWSGQFVKDVVDIVIQVVSDALGLNVFIYQDNRGLVEVLKICGGALYKDICVKFTHDNKHSIGNHYEPLVKQQLGNSKMKPNEVKIKNEEETSNQKQQKYQQSIPEDASSVHDDPNMVDETSVHDDPSLVDEASVHDHPSMVDEASVHDNPSTQENIQTPTSYAGKYEYEDGSIPIEQEGPLDLTTKNKKQQSETTQHIPLPIERRKRILNPEENFGVIFTKEETDDEAQYESEIIDDTTVFTIKSGKPFPTWLYENINAEFVQQVSDLINGFKLYIVNSTLEDYSDDTVDLLYFDLKTSSKRRYSGIWKGGICQGSWECPNPHCTFKAFPLTTSRIELAGLMSKDIKTSRSVTAADVL